MRPHQQDIVAGSIAFLLQDRKGSEEGDFFSEAVPLSKDGS